MVGLIFFFVLERNLLGFIVLIACAAAAAILFSEKEMDERVKKTKEARQQKEKTQNTMKSGHNQYRSHLTSAHTCRLSLKLNEQNCRHRLSELRHSVYFSILEKLAKHLET